MGSSKACQGFREKLINAWAFYMLSFLFLSTYVLILINYEYEVIFEKKDITFLQNIFQKETGG